MTNVMLQLLGAALLVDATAALLYLAVRRTAFGRWKRWPQQVIIGVVFGGLAVLGTEFGVTLSGATLNVRDAAPLCAGLIFGAPAGIIAGVIGAAERWLAVYWGAGTYTRLACTLATLCAGLFGAGLRVYMLDDKKPQWFYALLVGLVTEVLHMLMIFVTNMNDVGQAFAVVRLCALPMISANGFAVTLAVLLVTLLSGEPLSRRHNMRKIAETFQRWLLACVVVAFACTCAFTYYLQTRLMYGNAYKLLQLNVVDICDEIQSASDKNLLTLTHRVARELEQSGGVNVALLPALAERHGVAEIDVIGRDGVIRASTEPSFVGFDMASGEQSAAFLPLLSGTAEIVQSYQPIAYNPSISRKYAGVPLSDGGFLQLGYDAEQFQSDIDAEIVGVTRNRRVGESGYVLICDQTGAIVSDNKEHTGKTLADTGLTLGAASAEGERLTATVYGERALCLYGRTEGYDIYAVQPESEALLSRNISLYVMAFMEVVVFAMVFASIYFLIKRIVVDNLGRVNASLAKITGGNLNVTVDVRANEEFASLSQDINATVDTLKRYIAEAAARIDRELAFARTIQKAALPSVFPPYPGRDEFDIYAMMTAAKEVGGDFYDFYLLGDRSLAFLIADVSGKGVPAAMFMMTAKTLLKSYAETGLAVEEVLTRANQRLCEGNDADMFVTAWMGILNLDTGRVVYANAGHNPPLTLGADGGCAYLRTKPGFVLGGMPGLRYRAQELTLRPGERLFLYTDGVTEATDGQDRLYGEERLQAALEQNRDAEPQALVEAVKADVDAFVGDAPQFDDITMLTLTYRGGHKG